jgi:hypothetical protein
MKMCSPVSRLVINFCCKDARVGVETSCSDCPVDYPVDAETKMACLEELLLCSAVDGQSGTPLPTLVMGESIFLNDLPDFIVFIVRHDIHGCHYKSWN